MKLADDRMKDTLMKMGVLVALFLVAQSADAKNKKDIADDDIASKPEAGRAKAIGEYLRPYGAMWMRWLFGINVDGIMEVAKQIKDLKAVADEYQLLYGESMHDDLTLCIGPDLYQKFLALASQGKTGSWYFGPKSENVPANYWVITKLDTNVRRTPKLERKYAVPNNIVKTVGKGMILGATTGKYGYDEANKVLFVEFWTLLKNENKRVTYYAAKSQIDLLSQADKQAREKKEGPMKLEILEGVGGSEDEPQQQVVSTMQVTIYNEKFKPIGKAPKHTIIGFPLLTLSTDNGKYLQIKTVQGMIRWVRADQVTIQNRNF